MAKPDDKPAPPKKENTFFVSGEKYTTEADVLTGLQIKAKVPNWDPNHDLVLEGHGNEADKVIKDDEPVSMVKDQGPPRFSSAPKANFG